MYAYTARPGRSTLLLGAARTVNSLFPNDVASVSNAFVESPVVFIWSCVLSVSRCAVGVVIVDSPSVLLAAIPVVSMLSSFSFLGVLNFECSRFGFLPASSVTSNLLPTCFLNHSVATSGSGSTTWFLSQIPSFNPTFSAQSDPNLFVPCKSNLTLSQLPARFTLAQSPQLGLCPSWLLIPRLSNILSIWLLRPDYTSYNLFRSQTLIISFNLYPSLCPISVWYGCSGSPQAVLPLHVHLPLLQSVYPRRPSQL